MKTEIDILSDKEVEILGYAKSQKGTMDFVIEKLSAEGIFEQYRNVHKSYLELYLRSNDEAIKLEIIKRLIFLNWYALVEPSCYTGIGDLDVAAVSESYSILHQYLMAGKIDTEFKWMLSFYVSLYYAILPFLDKRLETLTAFVKEVDTSALSFPQDHMLEAEMVNRGQMGVYWRSRSAEPNTNNKY